MAETWRSRLKPASYKDVRFYVDAVNATWGRRVFVQKFAGGGSLQDDQGLDPREFDVTAYLWGPDYDRARDRLESALAEGGPGPLVLPTRKVMTARITRGPQTLEQRTEGGYCVVRFSVVQEEPAGGLKAEADTSQQLTTASAEARAAYVRFFTANVKTAGLNNTQLAYISPIVQGATRTIARVSRMLSGVLAPVQTLQRDLDALNAGATQLISTPSFFVTTAIDLVLTAYSLPETAVTGIDRVAGLPSTIMTAFGTGRGARLIDRGLAAFRGFGEPFVSGSSSKEKQATTNAMAVAALMRTGAVTAAADAYAEVRFDSATFAISALDRSLAELDALQQLPIDDDTFAALDRLRAALTRHLYETAGRIPESTTVQLRVPTTSIILAHRLYGDASLEADIVQRNNTRDPTRMNGAVEVLRS